MTTGNAFLIKGKEVQADPKSMYWGINLNAMWFAPDMQDMVKQLRNAYNNFEEINANIEKQRQLVFDKFGWHVIAKQILDLAKVKNGEKIKILWMGFAGKNHSWSLVAQNLCRHFDRLGHEVHIASTNGETHFPIDLKPNLKFCIEEGAPIKLDELDKKLLSEYDVAISFTAPKNFKNYLNRGKIKFGIWCYEFIGKEKKDVLPQGWGKYYKDCDYILAPSKFARDIFLNSGVPNERIKVVPHGIDVDQYSKNTKMQLPTNKKFKILANVAQNHLRKNIPQLLNAFGQAFTKNDDVCLILKGKEKPIQQPFEISLNECIKNFKNKYPSAAEFKLLSDFIDDISVLYRSCDAFFTATRGEGFLLPALESISSGKLVIAPNWSAHTEFLQHIE